MILVQWRQVANIVIRAILTFYPCVSTFNFSIGQFLSTTDVRERDQVVERVETVDKVEKCINFRNNLGLLQNRS
jgi:hypothetical protein